MLNTSINSQNNAHLPFQSIKPTLRICDQAVREFKQEFPALKSNTAIELKILNLYGTQNEYLIPKLRQVRHKFDEQVTSLRFDREFFETALCSPSLKFKTLKKLVKKYQAGNCGEQADIMQYELLQKGLKAKQISFCIKNQTIPRKCNDHVFVVVDLAEKAKINKPETWGTKAIIVDPWSGLVGKAHDVLKEIMKNFRFNEKKEKLDFKIDNFC
ncbi:MAG TPA: hypothetical protein P5556_08305 [Candidatus Gastranaerophilales bacterium]|nr:hypothetical protein [Candidatus Gastranaerophilales bacterium]